MSQEKLLELLGGGHKSANLLAPMVRAGHLPLRLLALHFGATAVYSEELVCKKLLKCVRVENEALKTVDFILPSQSNKIATQPVYRTCALERGRNVLQIGAANPEEAAQVCELFSRDVASVDLNMGCPESFSLSGGMGAALLKKPDTAAEILRAMRRSVPLDKPVTCKIRLLDEQSKTIALIQQLEQAGAEQITIHARRVPDRPRDPARWNDLQAIVHSCNVPIVVNGDVHTHLEDAPRVMGKVPSACGTMVARGAIADVASAFHDQKCYKTCADLAHDYLRVAQICGNVFGVDKWFLSQVIRYRSTVPSEASKQLLTARLTQSKTLAEMCRAFDLDENQVLIQDTAAPESDTPEAWSQAFHTHFVQCSRVGERDMCPSKRCRVEE